MDKHIKELLESDSRLSKEEEIEVFHYYNKIKSQESETENALECRNLIIMKNMGLVSKFASRFSGFKNNYDDLCNESVFGLITAIDRFDPDLGYKFSTYASNWITQSLLRYNDNCESAIRMPVHICEKYQIIEKAKYDYNLKNNCDPNIPTISTLTGFSEESIRNILSKAHQTSVVSLNTPIGEGDHGECYELEDVLEGNENVEESLIYNVDMIKLRKILKENLPDREYDIICRRTGLYTGKPQTLEEIGNDYGVTRERIRQLEAKAVKKMRSFRIQREIKDFKEYIK